MARTIRAIVPDVGQGSLSRRVLPAVLVVMALVLAAQAWNRLTGFRYYADALSLKNGWYAQAGAPHDRELHESFKLGYRAAEHDKANSDYRFLLASLHAWRERGLRLWPDQSAAETRKIVESLKAALVRRPTWYEPWILLALVKFQSRQIDHELQVALEKAIENGKYETAVHHGLSVVGLRLWDRLGPELRGRVAETLNIALDNPEVREFVVEQIVMAGRVELFRDRLESNEQLSKLMDGHLEKLKESL